MTEEIDINENQLWQRHPHLLENLLEKLLFDQTTQKNIIWATDSYASMGDGFQWKDHITPEHITGEKGKVIQPRALKTPDVQNSRIKDKAEVFTPSWICNLQNNLIDNVWFGRENVFNTETTTPDSQHSWIPTTDKIRFNDDEGKSWKDYVRLPRLEIACGEAPYLVSRYDTVTGNPIEVGRRIGLLDRKLRVVSENVENASDWIFWAKTALSASYGYEWQGDNLLLARKALFFSVIDFFNEKFNQEIPIKDLEDFAFIISWNLWQMDGLKCVVPDSCQTIKEYDLNLFGDNPSKGEKKTTECECPSCKKGKVKNHNSKYKCLIAEWNTESLNYDDDFEKALSKKTQFQDLITKLY